jgi:hypothetical protein
MGVDIASIPFPSVVGPEAARASAGAECLSAERGRELARLQVEEMIEKIRRRASVHGLDRGLSLSLPYFDDRAGELRWRRLEIIPNGRVPFIPAFVVLAARKEAREIEQDGELPESTKAHLLGLLLRLEQAFLRRVPRD